MFGKINPKNIPFKKVSLRDILLILGLSLLTYGLYQFRPWVAYTVCGFLVMFAGFFMKEAL